MALVLYIHDIPAYLGLRKSPLRAPVSWKEYETYLKSLEPNDWKTHDHYRVLRLEHRRYAATNSEIQKTYRDIARRLHPDKCPGSDLFYCNVIRSSEVLLDSQRRRAFDSVDPLFDETVPEGPFNDFFAELGPVFRSNARFSIIQPVPDLGSLESTRDEVNAFYRFWFEFESWREFSYLDEEDKTNGQDRYERKAIEKKNKIERKRREKEDAKRIHCLVQKSFDNDPRIKEFKEEDKRLKRERREKKRIEMQKQQVPEEVKPVVEEIKDELPEQKKPIKDERKKFRRFVRSLPLVSETDQVRLYARADRMMFGSDFDALFAINQRLDLIEQQSGALEVLIDLIEKFEICERDDAANKRSAVENKTQETKEKPQREWNNEEIDLLIKAVRAYPAGTAGRWTLVAEYINKHLSKKGSEPRHVSEVVKMAGTISKDKKYTGVNSEDVGAWSSQDQQLLEKGLRSVKQNEPDRWNKIAEMVPGKSAQECITRYRYIVERLKKKREAAIKC